MSFIQKEVKCIQSNATLNLYVSSYKIVIKILKFSVYLILWHHPNFGWFIYKPLTCFWDVLIVRSHFFLSWVGWKAFCRSCVDKPLLIFMDIRTICFISYIHFNILVLWFLHISIYILDHESHNVFGCWARLSYIHSIWDE